MSRRPALFLMLALAGCADFPELRGIEAQVSGPAPVILPIDELVAQAQLPPGDRTALGPALAARAAALRARAAAMRGPVNDPATRARLADAILRGA